MHEGLDGAATLDAHTIAAIHPSSIPHTVSYGGSSRWWLLAQMARWQSLVSGGGWAVVLMPPVGLAAL